MNKGIIELKNSGYEIFQYYSTVNMYLLVYKDRNILKDDFKI